MKLSLSKEKELIERARHDPNAFGVVFDSYYEQIFNYSLRRLGDSNHAADITSIVFLKAYKNLWQYEFRGLPFLAWLYRIAGNEIKNFYRDQSKTAFSLTKMQQEYGIEWSDDTDYQQELDQAQEQVEASNNFNLVKKYLKELSVDYQEVLSLRYFEGYKIKDIAEITGKKQGTIKSLLSRGVAQLKNKIESNKITQSGWNVLQQLRLKSVIEVNN